MKSNTDIDLNAQALFDLESLGWKEAAIQRLQTIFSRGLVVQEIFPEVEAEAKGRGTD